MLVDLHATCLEARSPLSPLQSSLGPYGTQLPSVIMRRHCIGLAVERLCTGKMIYVCCSLFTALLASSEG